MNQAMWLDPNHPKQSQRLKDAHGANLQVIGPAEGQQACGDVGPGRMLEPELIAQTIAEQFESGILAGVSVVITAGPTREAIDPVRYISNHSSGKMGYALAAAARDAGARVDCDFRPCEYSPP